MSAQNSKRRFSLLFNALLLGRLVLCSIAIKNAEFQDEFQTRSRPDIITEAASAAPTIDDRGPAFVQQPESQYYILKTKPVITITCKAVRAVQINFLCVDQWVQSHHHTSSQLVDPTTGIRYLETSIQLIKQDVESHGGSEVYWCECHAWNSQPDLKYPLSAKSARGLVRVAYLRRAFDREPLSIAVKMDSTVQLECLPPVGVPIPEVFWLKDGIQIDFKFDNNVILSNENNLIIIQARLTDAGAYACGAQNIAGRRQTEAATLTIYVNGGWSTWSQWSDCNVPCGKGLTRRSRACNNPAPLNDGEQCIGDDVQRIACISPCPVDGMWSTWSSWSPCGDDCRHHRRRLCDNPPPGERGLYCNGSDLHTVNCTGEFCPAGVMATEILEENYKTYVSLIVALSAFIIVLAISAVFLRRKRQRQASNAKKLKSTQRLLSLEITQTVVAVENHDVFDRSPIHREKSPPSILGTSPELLFAPNGLATCRSDQSTILTAKPYATLSRAASPRSYYEKHPYATIKEPRTAAGDIEVPHVHKPGRSNLLSVAIGTPGGRIKLTNSDVSLTIPEGSVQDVAQQTEFFLAICHEDKYRPKLTDTQTVLSPVIMCSQLHGLPLRKPVILSLRHCASGVTGRAEGQRWALSLFCSDEAYNEPPQWQRLLTMDEEPPTTSSVHGHLDGDRCHILLDKLSLHHRLVLIGEPLPEPSIFMRPSSGVCKALRLAVFAPEVPASIDHCLRVYFVEDTKESMEYVQQVEKKVGGRLVDKSKQFLFQYGVGNLCLTLEQLGPGWRCKPSANYQEIPFGHIWSGTQSGLHCSFVVEHVDDTQQTLSCKILVHQQALQVTRQVIHISFKIREMAQLNTTRLLLNSPNKRTGRGSVSTLIVDSPQNVFRLPGRVKRRLGELLDTNLQGNDWRMLAQSLNLTSFVDYLSTKPSPAEHLLDVWEACSGGAADNDHYSTGAIIVDFMAIFRSMGRADAASALEQELRSDRV